MRTLLLILFSIALTGCQSVTDSMGYLYDVAKDAVVNYPTPTATPTATPIPEPTPKPSLRPIPDRSNFVTTGDEIVDFCAWYGYTAIDGRISVADVSTPEWGELVARWCNEKNGRDMPYITAGGTHLVFKCNR